MLTPIRNSNGRLDREPALHAGSGLKGFRSPAGWANIGFGFPSALHTGFGVISHPVAAGADFPRVGHSDLLQYEFKHIIPDESNNVYGGKFSLNRYDDLVTYYLRDGKRGLSRIIQEGLGFQMTNVNSNGVAA